MLSRRCSASTHQNGRDELCRLGWITERRIADLIAHVDMHRVGGRRTGGEANRYGKSDPLFVLLNVHSKGVIELYNGVDGRLGVARQLEGLARRNRDPGCDRAPGRLGNRVDVPASLKRNVDSDGRHPIGTDGLGHGPDGPAGR